MEEDKEMHEVSIPRIKIIASTKSELYRLLKNEGNYYLPPPSQTDGSFIHEVMTGIKKTYKQTQINYISVPQYKNLRVSDILKFAKEHSNIHKYLLDLTKNKSFPTCLHLQHRYDFIKYNSSVNILIPEKFEKFISNRVKEQENMYMKKKRLNMMVLPEFKNLFESASRVSRTNGNFIGVVKNTTQRRENVDEDIKYKKKIGEMELDSLFKDGKILALEERIKDFKEQNLKNVETIGKMTELYELGIIDEEGEHRQDSR